MEVPTDLIELRHAARIAKTHVSTVRRWILDGKIRGFERQGERRAKHRSVSRAELEAYLTPKLIVISTPRQKRKAKRIDDAWVTAGLAEHGISRN
jgi:predicted site-specific integrase-resolvase